MHINCISTINKVCSSYLILSLILITMNDELAVARGRNKRLQVGPTGDTSSNELFNDEDDNSDNADNLSVEDEYEYGYEDDDVVNEGT